MRQVCFSLRQSLMLLKPHLGSFYSLTVNNPISTFGPLDLLFPHQCEKSNAFEKFSALRKRTKNQVNKAGSPASMPVYFPSEVQRLDPIWNDLFTIPRHSPPIFSTLKVQPRLPLHPCPCHPWPLPSKDHFTKSSQTTRGSLVLGKFSVKVWARVF